MRGNLESSAWLSYLEASMSGFRQTLDDLSA